jgi:ATP-dependent metalloprotease FtsH
MNKNLLIISSLIFLIVILTVAYLEVNNIKVYIIIILFSFLGFMIFQNRDKILSAFRKEKKIIKKTTPINIKKESMDNLDIKPSKSNIFFKDVIGMNEVKDELNEIIDFTKNPNRYKKFNIKQTKGILMVGPSGVGKTMIAKAMANECGIPFFYESGASFAQIYVGSGPKKVKELFNSAKQLAPAIIFIDEIDSIGKARGEGRNDERENTLNELLTQMDGFATNNGIIVIGATNKIEVLDDALLRAGRFDKRVFLSLPQLSHREKILENSLSKTPHSVDIQKIAKLTSGFNNAGLCTLTNEASLNALKSNSDIVSTENFENVIDKVFLGKQVRLLLNAKEKEILANYQISKALFAIEYNFKFDKIELINFNIKEIDYQIESKKDIINKIRLHLSGSVGLDIIYHDSFTCSKNDIKIAIDLANKISNEYFMSDSFITKDNNIDTILKKELQSTKDYLLKYKDLILILSKELINNETIEFNNFNKIVKEYKKEE